MSDYTVVVEKRPAPVCTADMIWAAIYRELEPHVDSLESSLVDDQEFMKEPVSVDDLMFYGHLDVEVDPPIRLNECRKLRRPEFQLIGGPTELPLVFGSDHPIKAMSRRAMA